MATSKQFLAYVQDQCAGLEVCLRPMMGEYILYYREKYAMALCDNRLLVKDVPAARRLLPDALPEPPYEGAKPMLPVACVEDRAKLEELLEAVYPELPLPKPRKVKKHD